LTNATAAVDGHLVETAAFPAIGLLITKMPFSKDAGGIVNL
jgi:hypothetical protein